ncbi:MAG TPA: HtaA domain-containing protein [Solirubrobacterales bacterium]|nr:HtaA domain-containing protein [Solirubrobacterales bacterium]
MNLLSTLPRRARSAALPALLLASVLLAALATGTATAAPGTGEVTLTLKSDTKGSLSKQGVVATYSAKAGKTGSAKKRKQVSGGKAQILALPVADLALGTVPTVRAQGSIGLTLKGQSASLRDVIVQLGQKSTAISAKLDKDRVVFFRAKGTPQVDGSSVKLESAKLALTNAGAKALRAVLGADGITAGQAGSAAVDATLIAPAPTPIVTAPTPPHRGPIKIDDGGLKPEPDPDDPYRTLCPVGNVSGGPGFGHPPGTVSGIAPAPTFNSGTSQSVIGDSIEWGFKTSFRSYVLNVGGEGSMQPLDGAVATPAGATMATAGSTFDFPVADGTYEPGTAPNHSDDKLVSEGSGTVLFCKSGHGFSVVIKDPTITIDGENSRITADVGTNVKGTWYPFQRADIAELDLSGIEPQLSDSGNTLVWEDIPAKMSADGFAATGELYDADTPLDTVTVKTAVQRPLLTECAIDSGTVPPTTAVDFTKAALPTLNNPVTGSGGTINWGFRRATRNTVVLPDSGGSFQLLSGATEGYPGNMGGGNSAAPSGGLGKFFRFPIAQYSYEEGAPGDPGDDRLVATSNATVGFCNPGLGNFALVISKPTLVIDGGNSRLVANAYSYSGGFGPSPGPKGWIGGRVELVDLDTSAVDATTGLGTVRWGDVPADETPLTSGIPVDGGLKTEALSLASLTVLSTATGGFDPVSAQIELPAEPHPFETECPVPVSGGPPAFGEAPGEVSGLAALPTFNSGTSQSVTGSSLEWGFKDSFRSYVGNVPPAGSMQALGVATANPAGPSMAIPGSFFGFPVAAGTYEPGTAPDHSDDKLVTKGSGTALFCKSGHGFDIAIRNPTVVIDGENSRITADVGTNQNGTWYRFQRADIAELDLSGVEPQLSDGGNTLVWEDIPAKMSADGALASGIYDAGETLDPITVKTAVQRPLLAECTIDAGVGTPPAVDFTQAALPTLTDPVTGSGGTINWGFRRSLRSSVSSTGSFQLLGGASAGYPGNMGGGATPAPTGGLGKFFRFPVSEYAYEAGTADPTDDRLIATSEATVSFCNPAAGNYGLVISKPTLVIDGANSRLVANAYSYRNPSLGWAGGRVDLVALDDGTISAVAETGTVRWGDIPADNNPIENGIAVDGGLLTNALTLANLAQGAGGGGFDPITAQIALPTP